MLNANKLPSQGATSQKYPPVANGTYPARLVQFILLGIQPERPYAGETKPPRLKARATYELLDEFLVDEDGEEMLDKPRWVSEEFAFLNLKADLATSTKRYKALDPNDEHGGDWGKLLGAPCMVNIVQEADKRPGYDRIYEKVSGVSAMRDREIKKAPDLVNEPRVFDFYDGSDDNLDVFLALPEWIQNKIKGAVDFGGGVLDKALQNYVPEKEEVAEDKPVAKKTHASEKPSAGRTGASKKKATLVADEDDEGPEEGSEDW